jgi:hypothetical protein
MPSMISLSVHDLTRSQEHETGSPWLTRAAQVSRGSDPWFLKGELARVDRFQDQVHGHELGE